MSSEQFRCDTCLKSFCTQGRYNQHLKTHSKPYRCELCQRGFALRLDLNRHIKARHRLGDDPFRCPYNDPLGTCHFQSNRKDNLTRHLQNAHRHEHMRLGANEQADDPMIEDRSSSQSSPISLDDHESPHQLYSEPLFRQAASSGNIGIIEASLNAGIDLHSKGVDGSTALHCAARASETLTVQYLLQKGAETQILNNHGRLPLAEAIIGGSPETVGILLNALPTIPVIDDVEKYLGRSGNFATVQLYIDHPSTHCATSVLNNVLMAAIRFRQTALVAALLAHPRIQINEKDKTGIAPIHQAVRHGGAEILNLLLACESLDLNITTRVMWYTPLHLAVIKDDLETVKILLKHASIMVNHRTKHGIITALSLAARQGHVKIVEQLLDYHDVNIECLDGYGGRGPLHSAASNGHLEVFKLLCGQDDFNINKKIGGRTALHIAAISGQTEVVKFLLGQDDIDTTCQDSTRGTTLHGAAFHGYVEVAKLLLEQNDAIINYKNHRGQTPLHVAIECGHSKFAKVLLEQASIDVFCEDNVRLSPLQLAVHWGRWEIVSMMLDYLEFLDGHVDTPMQTTTTKPMEQTEIFDRLFRHPDFQDIDTIRLGGFTLLQRAIQTGAYSLLEYLLTRKDCNVNMTDENGWSFLYTATMHNNIDAVKILLQHKDIDINCGCTKTGMTPLFKARQLGHQQIIDLLVSHGIKKKSRSLSTTNRKEPVFNYVPKPSAIIQPETELGALPPSSFVEYMIDDEMDDFDLDEIFDKDTEA